VTRPVKPAQDLRCSVKRCTRAGKKKNKTTCRQVARGRPVPDPSVAPLLHGWANGVRALHQAAAGFSQAELVS
jgi:hypothetical protein